ncbi:MAG: hypothetical protein J1G38_01450 [Clostridiales bacterium]|nr:hypothetical protein [Clostridiales bacterium]
MTAEDGTNHTGKVYHYYKKKNGAECNKSNITKEKSENLVFEKTIEYILQPQAIEKIAVSVVESLNEGLSKSDLLVLLEADQRRAGRAEKP